MERKQRAVTRTASATAGFVGQYFSDFVTNLVRGKPDLFVRASGYEKYIAGIASGFTSAVFSSRIALLPLTLLTTGVYYGIARVLSSDDAEPLGNRLVPDYLRDVFIIFLLLLLLQEQLSKSERFRNQQSDPWADALSSGILPSVYFGLRDIIFPNETAEGETDNNKKRMEQR